MATENRQLEILYEDADILVCVKPHGVATQSKRIGSPDMVNLLKNYLYQKEPGKGEPYLAVIHRLDQPVKGILVFAKTPAAAKKLNQQLQSKGFGKYYHALVSGRPPKAEDTLENYLVKDGRTNTSRVCSADTPGAKIARLHYKILKTEPENVVECKQAQENTDDLVCKETLLEVHLDTGRHHQIRVQLSHMGCPIVGDTKYHPQAKDKAGWQEIQLCAYKLDFSHPRTNKPMHFEIS
jgi:23S rRNA pseudouridine1911/1915/1917 synthase